MPERIRITQTPPGGAPEEIRDQWVGAEMNYVKMDDGNVEEGHIWGTDMNAGGYIVRIEDALEGLKAAGKDEAYEFWAGLFGTSGRDLRFSADCCEEVK